MIAFGPFVLIPSQQLLLKSDQQVQMGTRAIEILTCLAERAGEIVSKEDFIARVWINDALDMLVDVLTAPLMARLTSVGWKR